MDNDTLAEIFIEQAEWRVSKASEFPDDDRNAAAATIFRRLAESAAGVPAELIMAAEELVEDAPDADQWNQMLREVGFHRFPDNAEQFLNDFIASRTS